MWDNDDRMVENRGENVYAVNIRLSAIEYLEKWSKKLHIVEKDAIRGMP
jgi:hypothetical protein